MIVHSSSDLFGQSGARSEFLIRRIARIVPPYWATTLILIWTYTSIPPDFTSVLQSLLFIPYTNASGSMNPVHGVGWTLNFEMLFNVVFAICIAWPRRIAVPAVTGTFAIAIALRCYFNPSAAPSLFWTDPIILEFVFGMWIAMLYGRIDSPQCAYPHHHCCVASHMDKPHLDRFAKRIQISAAGYPRGGDRRGNGVGSAAVLIPGSSKL